MSSPAIFKLTIFRTIHSRYCGVSSRLQPLFQSLHIEVLVEIHGCALLVVSCVTGLRRRGEGRGSGKEFFDRGDYCGLKSVTYHLVSGTAEFGQSDERCAGRV